MPRTFTLAKVHETIQTVFGWTDRHLLKFYTDRTACAPDGHNSSIMR